MTKIGVLMPEPACQELFTAASRARLERMAEVVWNDTGRQLTEQEAAEFLRTCDIAVSSWRTPAPSKAILESAGKLKLWQHAAGTVKPFFTEDLRGTDLIIASCAPAIAKTVAEMVLAELLMGLRRIIPNSQQNRTQRGAKPVRKLYAANATVGVIGASWVGRTVLGLLRPFGMRVLLYDPYCTKETAASLGAEKVDTLLELCEACDAITLHTPKLPETYRMVGEREFQAMKDDCVFINTSRGPCIDEQALIAELQKGRLFAFLDVSDPEPADISSPLRTLPNVIYTSHISGEASVHIGNQVADDIEAYLAGNKPLMAVHWDMLERMA
ncbi:MAG: 3-phosphoglycerate dehydrogenase [Paenibacillus sp.]|jgi:phosphoglycerate dehydrogenase-like enzyme|nr:3-phosphoglycerate dehydrogenase [Paenibacillus sp.]